MNEASRCVSREANTIKGSDRIREVNTSRGARGRFRVLERERVWEPTGGGRSTPRWPEMATLGTPPVSVSNQLLYAHVDKHIREINVANMFPFSE